MQVSTLLLFSLLPTLGQVSMLSGMQTNQEQRYHSVCMLITTSQNLKALMNEVDILLQQLEIARIENQKIAVTLSNQTK